jgi:hypothetical protein
MGNQGTGRARRVRAWLADQVAAPREVRSARTRGPIVAELLPKGGVGAELVLVTDGSVYVHARLADGRFGFAALSPTG